MPHGVGYIDIDLLLSSGLFSSLKNLELGACETV